ncbi:MAG: hypothetical protein M3Q95_03220 [Bacteroidota bacterium]|nr:hypothetical protein [Bacteroidota bacterium]
MGVPNIPKLSEIDVKNTQTNIAIATIKACDDSRGIAIDQPNNKLYVTNRNISGGYLSHHALVCDGKNKNVTMIDINTIQLTTSYKNELSVDLYDIVISK